MAHALFVVEPAVADVGEIGLNPQLVQALQGCRVAALAASLVAQDVRGDAIEPRQRLLALDLDVVASAPSFEKDDRGQILRKRCVRRTTEAVAVNALRVAVPQRGEPVAVVTRSGGTRPR